MRRCRTPRVFRIPREILLVLATVGTACASAPKTQADRVREMLEALAEAPERDPVFVVRWKPVPCECPEWEVRLEGSWHRAFLEPAGDPVDALRKELQDPEGNPLPRTARVLGKLSTGTRVSPNRTQCLVLKVFASCQEAECEPAP